MPESKKRTARAFRNLVDFQADAYPPHIPKVESLDSLQFARSVISHFPVLFTVPVPNWTPNELVRQIGETQISVAETPNGRADAPNGSMFVQPHTEVMSLASFMDKLHDTDCVRYMQSQDNNMNKEFSSLKGMPKSFDWADNILGPPEAVNLWVGERRTVSRLHNDNYENVFCQVAGTKLVALIPPSHACYVKEKPLKSYRYEKNVVDGACNFEMIDDAQSVVFPTFDPSENPSADFVYWVSLGPGDALYLPALWYHQIHIQSSYSVSVNYWYPSTDVSGHWGLWNLSRQILLNEAEDGDLDLEADLSDADGE